MIGYAVADISLEVTLDFDEHALWYDDLEVTQDFTVVVQVMVERVVLVQIAVQEVFVFNLHAAVDKLGWLLDHQEEVIHRPVPAEYDGDGEAPVRRAEVVAAHGKLIDWNSRSLPTRERTPAGDGRPLAVE